jgi:RNA polymerase sigma-70 factor (ECF subfamily)
MSGMTGSGEEQRECSAGVLGDLLYADKGHARACESEWITLVRSIASGDQRALRALYERTNRLVFTLTMRITNDRQTAEEVTLDVFHEVWQRAPKYDPADGSVVGWIMNQARSRAIDRLRFEKRKKRASPSEDDSIASSAASGSDEVIDLVQQAHMLRDRLSLLTPDERNAIETAYFMELTHSEVAARLNQPLGTVKTRIRSGLDKLRRALAQEAS